MITIRAIGKYLSLFISWLLFSPLYFWLSKRISNQSVWKRSIWTVLSPFSLVLIILYFPLNEMAHFTGSSSLHRITGAKLPFKCIYNTNGLLNFTLRDCSTTCHAFFLNLPTEMEYAKLDSLCNIKSSYWYKSSINNKEVYSYSRVWGNEIEAPQGENEDDDRFLNISLEKGSKNVVIEYGSW